MYKVIWEAEAEEGLNKIDFATARKIKARVENYLVHNPTKLGKPLKHKWQSHYRYRYGGYRIIYQVKNEEVVIIVVRVDRRKEVYWKNT